MSEDPMAALQNKLRVLQTATPPFVPADAEVMTIVVDYPPGDPGVPPHRHPGGPAFGYVVEGEMLFELEGEAPRVIKAGEAFWEPGGDVIHYSDGNNSSDAKLQFLVTMMCAPGQPMLVLVDDDELEQRRDRRVPRSE
jgi:quercetin dioxygenase-like cupin family protein